MYNLIADKYSSLFPPDKQRCGFILSEINIKTAAVRVLDAGCATGDLSFELADRGCHVTGIDLDNEMIKIAEARAAEYKSRSARPAFYLGSITDIQRYGSFNSVVCFGNTLPHLPLESSVLQFFSETAKVLSPAGRLIFQIINFDLLAGRESFEFPVIETEDSIFRRRYLKRTDGRIDFMINLTDRKSGATTADSVPLLPLSRAVITEMLLKAGFAETLIYSGYDRIPADGSESASIYSASL